MNAHMHSLKEIFLKNLKANFQKSEAMFNGTCLEEIMHKELIFLSLHICNVQKQCLSLKLKFHILKIFYN